MPLMIIDLRENYWHESNRRFKAMIDALEYQSYLDGRDWGGDEGQREYDEHFKWFEDHMPHLVPYVMHSTVKYFMARMEQFSIQPRR